MTSSFDGELGPAQKDVTIMQSDEDAPLHDCAAKSLAQAARPRITIRRAFWTKLTRFLEVAGAPLDSNLVERALKKAILHRKGALFYKTENGARVGDLFMSAIHTCELNGVNAFEYMVELQRHADALKEAPHAWLPWTYRETLQKIAVPSAA